MLFSSYAKEYELFHPVQLIGYLVLLMFYPIIPGAQRGAGPLAMGFWCSMPISAAPSNTFNILLGFYYNLVTVTI